MGAGLGRHRQPRHDVPHRCGMPCAAESGDDPAPVELDNASRQIRRDLNRVNSLTAPRRLAQDCWNTRPLVPAICRLRDRTIPRHPALTTTRHQGRTTIRHRVHRSMAPLDQCFQHIEP